MHIMNVMRVMTALATAAGRKPSVARSRFIILDKLSGIGEAEETKEMTFCVLQASSFMVYVLYESGESGESSSHSKRRAIVARGRCNIIYMSSQIGRLMRLR